MKHTSEESREGVHILVAVSALRPQRGDDGTLDRKLPQDRHQRTSLDVERDDIRQRDADAADHEDGRDRIAEVCDAAGVRREINRAAADLERPAQSLARTLEAEIHAVVVDVVVRMLRCPALLQVDLGRESAEPMRRETPGEQAGAGQFAHADRHVNALLDEVGDAVPRALVDK